MLASTCAWMPCAASTSSSAPWHAASERDTCAARRRVQTQPGNSPRCTRRAGGRAFQPTAPQRPSRASYLVAEVHMAGRIYEIQQVVLPVMRVAVHKRRRLRLDGDAALSLHLRGRGAFGARRFAGPGPLASCPTRAGWLGGDREGQRLLQSSAVRDPGPPISPALWPRIPRRALPAVCPDTARARPLRRRPLPASAGQRASTCRGQCVPDGGPGSGAGGSEGRRHAAASAGMRCRAVSAGRFCVPTRGLAGAAVPSCHAPPSCAHSKQHRRGAPPQRGTHDERERAPMHAGTPNMRACKRNMHICMHACMHGKRKAIPPRTTMLKLRMRSGGKSATRNPPCTKPRAASRASAPPPAAARGCSWCCCCLGVLLAARAPAGLPRKRRQRAVANSTAPACGTPLVDAAAWLRTRSDSALLQAAS